MAGGPLETSGAFVEGAVDANVLQFSTLEAGFMVSGVVIGEGCIVVAAGPPDFSASDGSFFFFDQRGQ